MRVLLPRVAALGAVLWPLCAVLWLLFADGSGVPRRNEVLAAPPSLEQGASTLAPPIDGSRSAEPEVPSHPLPDEWWKEEAKIAEFREIYRKTYFSVYEGTERLRTNGAPDFEKTLQKSFVWLSGMSSAFNRLRREDFPNVRYDSAAELHRILLDTRDAYDRWGASIADDPNADRSAMLKNPFSCPPEYLCNIALGGDPDSWSEDLVAEVTRHRIYYLHQYLEAGAEQFVVDAALHRSMEAMGAKPDRKKYVQISPEWAALEEGRRNAQQQYLDAIRAACSFWQAKNPNQDQDE